MSNSETVIGSVEDLERRRGAVRESAARMKHVIRVCCGPGCIPKGAKAVFERFEELLGGADGGNAVVENRLTGCQGLCELGPIVCVDPGGIFYARVKKEDVEEIVNETIRNGRVVERLLYEDSNTGGRLKTAAEIPFYVGQQKVALALCGNVDARSLDGYLAAGGYSALARALSSMDPDEVIGEVTKSGLRGRGGGGFPTGTKWALARKAAGEPKYIIANGDEGDPGAFMDRALMEGVPHAVIEGMTIGGFAVGSSQGYLYVRDEYPIAVERLRNAIEQGRALGLLGRNILGTGVDFDIQINRGAGAFVCGEETGLMASLEGRVGEPRPKYVFPVEQGLYGKPTVINNVETWANIPYIISTGADMYASLGTETSKGTKVFSLVGKVNNTGLVEVPMGITLRQIIFDIGGGIRGGKAFKAVQTGGPSGGCIPADQLDSPVDFDRLRSLGSMMGSGGMIVMDEETCMVDVARYFLSFLRQESCGKCVPCREGVRHMLDILNRICEGRGREGDIELLEEIGNAVAEGALCMLGGTAPNPVLSTIRHFRGEYEAHIRDKRCPAGVCRKLITYSIDPEKCTGCMRCVKACTVGAITGERRQPHVIDAEKCIKCGACRATCRFDAVVVR